MRLRTFKRQAKNCSQGFGSLFFLLVISAQSNSALASSCNENRYRTDIDQYADQYPNAVFAVYADEKNKSDQQNSFKGTATQIYSEIYKGRQRPRYAYFLTAAHVLHGRSNNLADAKAKFNWIKLYRRARLDKERLVYLNAEIVGWPSNPWHTDVTVLKADLNEVLDAETGEEATPLISSAHSVQVRFSAPISGIPGMFMGFPADELASFVPVGGSYLGVSVEKFSDGSIARINGLNVKNGQSGSLLAHRGQGWGIIKGYGEAQFTAYEVSEIVGRFPELTDDRFRTRATPLLDAKTYLVSALEKIEIESIDVLLNVLSENNPEILAKKWEEAFFEYSSLIQPLEALIFYKRLVGNPSHLFTLSRSKQGFAIFGDISALLCRYDLGSETYDLSERVYNASDPALSIDPALEIDRRTANLNTATSLLREASNKMVWSPGSAEALKTVSKAERTYYSALIENADLRPSDNIAGFNRSANEVQTALAEAHASFAKLEFLKFKSDRSLASIDTAVSGIQTSIERDASIPETYETAKAIFRETKYGRLEARAIASQYKLVEDEDFREEWRQAVGNKRGLPGVRTINRWATKVTTDVESSDPLTPQDIERHFQGELIDLTEYARSQLASTPEFSE